MHLLHVPKAPEFVDAPANTRGAALTCQWFMDESRTELSPSPSLTVAEEVNPWSGSLSLLLLLPSSCCEELRAENRSVKPWLYFTARSESSGNAFLGSQGTSPAQI